MATAAIVLLAACGGSATDPAPTPTVPATVVVGLRAPVASNQTLTVYNGYDNPLVPSPCPKPGTAPHDHCGNQEYGLDFIPSDLADPRILAPISGKIGWPPGTGPLACLGITPTGTSTLNLTVCHFAADAIFVEQDDVVVQGQVLGLRDPRAWWIHLSLDDRAISPFQPVPFYDSYWIEGVAFVPRNPPVFDLYCGVTIKSTNGVAEDDPHADEAPYTTYAAAPALSCPPETPARTATPTATLAPTATSTLAPTPTPKPTLVPTPKPTPKPSPVATPTAASCWSGTDFTGQLQHGPPGVPIAAGQRVTATAEGSQDVYAIPLVAGAQLTLHVCVKDLGPGFSNVVNVYVNRADTGQSMWQHPLFYATAHVQDGSSWARTLPIALDSTYYIIIESFGVTTYALEAVTQ